MKRFPFFAGLMALFLLGMASCTEKPVENPGFDPDTNSVNTKFVLNVSTNAPSTKMTAETVQANGNFRGMDYVHVLTYNLNYKCAHGNYFMFKLTDESSKATRDYNLGNLVAADSISASKSSRVVELSVPVGTNCMMLYGLAGKTKGDEVEGAIIPTGDALNSTLQNLNFQLKNRLTNENAFTGFANTMARCLTLLMRSSLQETTMTGRDTRYAFWWPQDAISKTWATRDADGHPFTTPPDHPGYTYYTGTKLWSDYGEDYRVIYHTSNPGHLTMYPLEEVLGEAYYGLTHIEQKTVGSETYSELRAGSAASVLRTMRDLSEIVERVNASTATGIEEQVAIELSTEIKWRLSRIYNNVGEAMFFKDMATVMDVVKNVFSDYNTAVLPYIDDMKEVGYSTYYPDHQTLEGGFPMNLGLPMSAAILTWKEVTSGKWGYDYLTSIPAYGMGNVQGVPITDYRYPPELTYWANSGIRVSEKDATALSFPQTVANWADDTKWPTSFWSSNATVDSKTRTVAMMTQVNYGVAMLESTLMAGDQIIEDNKSGIFTGEANQTVNLTSNPNAFPVNGIFIGGVPDVVGWDFTRQTDNSFLPSGMTSNGFNKVIYDRFDTPVYMREGSGQKVYTLTWDSYATQMDATGKTIGPGRQEDQMDIYICMELTNNSGMDLWGEMNLIPNGSNFYLTGKLDLKGKTAEQLAAITFPEEKFFHYPPFTADGETNKVVRVFMQDYMTKAQITLGRHSLEHAYVTVPDLRAGQVSLGLSVDLTWQEGLDFAVLLGNVN